MKIKKRRRKIKNSKIKKCIFIKNKNEKIKSQNQRKNKRSEIRGEQR